MLKPSRLRDRLLVLESEVIPSIKSEILGIREGLEKISSQVSKLILVVSVAGLVDSPALMKSLQSIRGVDATPVGVSDDAAYRYKGGNEVIDNERK